MFWFISSWCYHALVQCHPDHMHIVRFMLQHTNIFCVIRLWLFAPQTCYDGAHPEEKSLNSKSAKYTSRSMIQLVEKDCLLPMSIWPNTFMNAREWHCTIANTFKNTFLASSLMLEREAQNPDLRCQPTAVNLLLEAEITSMVSTASLSKLKVLISTDQLKGMFINKMFL